MPPPLLLLYSSGLMMVLQHKVVYPIMRDRLFARLPPSLTRVLQWGHLAYICCCGAIATGAAATLLAEATINLFGLDKAYASIVGYCAAGVTLAVCTFYGARLAHEARMAERAAQAAAKRASKSLFRKRPQYCVKVE